jgi:UDP-3-O-[3-hydroxymyristoyl] glucosamine N-acyltransferase
MRITEFAAAMGSRVGNLSDDFEITGISTLEAAEPGNVSFVSGEKYLAASKGTRASALIVPEKVEPGGVAFVPLREPWTGVLFLLNHLHPADAPLYYRGVHPSAVVDPAAQLAADVTVGPNAVIGPRTRIGARTVVGPACVIGPDCAIGEDCLFHARVVVEHETVIGNRVIMQAGAAIGGDGFKYEVIGGKWTRIPQVGRVVIEDDAEIGANTTVDRASFTETRIGAGTKIDNLVQVAHNVRIGKGCVVVAQTGIAGSTEIGDGCILAASVGIADNLRIGNKVTILARSGVKDNIPDGQTIIGAPALPFRQAARIMAAQTKLPDLISEVQRLAKRVEELEKKNG